MKVCKTVLPWHPLYLGRWGGGEEGELTNQHKKKIDNNFALFLVSSVVLLGSSKLLQTF